MDDQYVLTWFILRPLAVPPPRHPSFYSSFLSFRNGYFETCSKEKDCMLSYILLLSYIPAKVKQIQFGVYTCPTIPHLSQPPKQTKVNSFLFHTAFRNTHIYTLPSLCAAHRPPSGSSLTDQLRLNVGIKRVFFLFKHTHI